MLVYMKNGKNNPRSPIYWQLRGLSEEEAKIQAKRECRKKSPRCIEYWILKGYDENEAQEKLREYQDNGKHNFGRKANDETKEKLRQSHKRRETIEYWNELYGEELGKIKYEEFREFRKECAKLGSKARKEKNPDSYKKSCIRRKEYWISQGYSEEEAKLIVSKKQSRSLDFYVQKYGEEEGMKRWNSRNEKWYNSFYKSGKDLDEVNQKRKLNSHVGYYTEKTIENIKKLNFYLITLLDQNDKLIVKYGLTKNDNIAKRWKVSLNYNLITFKRLDAQDALELEREFHKKFKNTYSPSVIKTTECFEYTQDNLNEALSIIKNYEETNQ